jgi:hypothetical protein
MAATDDLPKLGSSCTHRRDCQEGSFVKNAINCPNGPSRFLLRVHPLV